MIHNKSRLTVYETGVMHRIFRLQGKEEEGREKYKL
jgi:hypothetical protein